MTETDPERERRGSGLSDMMRKAVAAGMGAVFMTEESVRAYVSEAKLPREIARSIIQSSTAAKEQLLQYVSNEVSDLIQKTDLTGFLGRFLEQHEIEIEAKIRFRPTHAAAPHERPPPPPPPLPDAPLPDDTAAASDPEAGGEAPAR